MLYWPILFFRIILCRREEKICCIDCSIWGNNAACGDGIYGSVFTDSNEFTSGKGN